MNLLLALMAMLGIAVTVVISTCLLLKLGGICIKSYRVSRDYHEADEKRSWYASGTLFDMLMEGVGNNKKGLERLAWRLDALEIHTDDCQLDIKALKQHTHTSKKRGKVK